MLCCAAQWTGINTIIFYAPQLFITLGASQRASLAATIVTGIVNHFSTYVSLWAADEFGRRVLFIEGGIQMTIALVGTCLSAHSQHLRSMLRTSSRRYWHAKASPMLPKPRPQCNPG